VSASKKAVNNSGRSKQLPGVDGVTLASTEENGVDDPEVGSSW